MLKHMVRHPLDASKASPATILEESLMLSYIGRRVTSDTRHVHCIHNLTTNHAVSMSSSGRPIHLGAASETATQHRHIRMDYSSALIATPHERSEDMRLSRSYLAILLSLVLLAGFAGCGPASSDNAPGQESRANVSGPALSKRSSSPGTNSLPPITAAASPVPLAPSSDTGALTGKDTVQGGNSPQAVPVSSTKPADVLEPLAVPEWIAKDLESPDVGTRLRALDTWAQSAPPGAEDPLILALQNKDERVRSRAMELIEQNWARAADAEQ